MITLHSKPTSEGIRFSLEGLTEHDLLLLALAIKPCRRAVAQELETIQNPTIRSLRETGFLNGNNKEVQEQLSERLMQISQALNSSALKTPAHV